ncbi:MAG: hypothetical protein NT158_01980 [Cyanobacteria bacterium]|nr:hypothetical protein [Cyanobacteriota bacterium]
MVLFHGCDKDVAESVLSGEATLQPSENDYDWLGNGIYFWVDSPERALSWANLRRSSPSVIGAFAYPGNCLNLTDYGVMNELALAYEATLGISGAAVEFPRFREQVSGLHKIDCRGRREALLVIDWTEETDR